MSDPPRARSRINARRALAAVASLIVLLSSACSSSVASSGTGGTGGVGGTGGTGGAGGAGGTGGTGGAGASGSGGSPSDLPASAAVERTVLWVGYYPDTKAFMDSLAPENIGPTIASSPGHITVGWKALAYEDCREPKTVAIAARPDLDSVDRRGFSAIFGPPGASTSCNDNDFVSDVTATFEAPAGSYTFFIDTSVDGFWFDNADGSALDVDVPAP